jgi:hypothetical protein
MRRGTSRAEVNIIWGRFDVVFVGVIGVIGVGGVESGGFPTLHERRGRSPLIRANLITVRMRMRERESERMSE